jgi:Rieske Fe-S protein
MDTTAQNQRRVFLRSAFAGLGVFTLWLMNSVTRRAGALPEYSNEIITVPLGAGEGVRFFDNAIVVRRNGELTVLSSSCTHLGCQINRAEGNEIVCPCHGSRFDLNGQVIHGPAKRSLMRLAFDVDAAAALLHITLKK